MSEAAAKTEAFVGFHTSEKQREEIRRRAKRDDRTVAAWMRDRLGLLFEVDDQVNHDRRRSARRALTSHT